MVDERVEAGTVELHADRRQHLVRAFGEGAQNGRSAVIGVSERRLDEARELLAIGLEALLCSHGRSPAHRSRAPIPSLSRRDHAV
jgi:hypothetical protein